MDRADIWRHIREQRLRLADFLEGLSEEQLATPSLAEGWTVRHIAAHASFAGRWQHLPGLIGFAKAGFNFNKMVDQDTRRLAERPVPELIRLLRDVADSRSHPPGTVPADPLTDILVHSLDAAVPLGVDWPLPPDAAVVAAQRVWSMPFPFFAKRRLKGKRLEAANADWSAGDGELVREPIESLLLRLTGRTPPPDR